MGRMSMINTRGLIRVLGSIANLKLMRNDLNKVIPELLSARLSEVSAYSGMITLHVAQDRALSTMNVIEDWAKERAGDSFEIQRGRDRISMTGIPD